MSTMELIKFTKKEINLIGGILLIIFIVVSFNLDISIRKGRDTIRKDDISAIQKSLEDYLKKFGVYPLSTADGRIIGCFNESPALDPISNRPTNAVACEWGSSNFEFGNMPLLIGDPRHKDGINYRYDSDGENYSLYVYLEGGKSEAEYTQNIVDKNLQCGTKVCNYGRGTRIKI
jgi:hypothetical protein